MRQRWIKIVYAKTVYEFNTAWQSLKDHYRDESYLSIFQYLMKTWLKHKEMFVKAWTNSQLHFDNAASNRAEGINYSTKYDLPNSRGNLQDLLDAFKVYILGHIDKLAQSLKNDRTNRHPRLGKNPLYNRLWGVISHFAIKKVEVDRERYNLHATDPDNVIIPECTKVMRKSIGLPYAHIFQ